MRKISFIASAFIMSFAVTTVSCSNNEEATATTEAVETTAQEEVEKVTEFAKYVRYVDMQKIQQQYTLWQELVQTENSYAEKLASYQKELGAGLQKKQTAIEEKRNRNGYLTQESFNQDVQALEKAQNDANTKLAQRQEQYSLEMSKKLEVVQDSIYSVINFMSEKYQLDAILEKGAGLYLNPQLNLTDEVIAELNTRLAK